MDNRCRKSILPHRIPFSDNVSPAFMGVQVQQKDRLRVKAYVENQLCFLKRGYRLKKAFC